VRRDPMAMIPFIGYNVGDYFNHWLKLGRSAANRPRIFGVNWFRTDASGKFIWPGFGENMRVLKWIVERCQGKAHAVKTPIGYVPQFTDLEWKGLEGFSDEQFRRVTSIDPNAWRKEIPLHAEMVQGKLADKAPAELMKRFEELKAAFA